jgi:hypothetical protein
MSEVTWGYLQNLVCKGYMMVAECATYLVPMDPVSHALVKGFIVVCVAFCEQIFGVPPHRFLRSLLWSYGLELHHMTLLEILHIVAFMTLCKAYIGIEPPLNLWSHFL